MNIKIYYELPDLPNVNLGNEFYDDVGELVVKDLRLGYARQKSPSGVPWMPSKRVQQHGGLTLVLTGAMRSSLTHSVGKEFVDVGYPLLSGKSIPRFLHEGHSKGYFPAREHLGVSTEAEKQIAKLLEKVLQDD